MKIIVIGIAAAIVIAVGAGIWLETIQQTSSDLYTAASSVRL